MTEAELQNRLLERKFNISKSNFYIFIPLIDLVTVSDAILTGRQTRLEIQHLYGNPLSNYFHKTALLNNS